MNSLIPLVVGANSKIPTPKCVAYSLLHPVVPRPQEGAPLVATIALEI